MGVSFQDATWPILVKFNLNIYWVNVKSLTYKKLKATDLYNIGSKKSFILFGNVNWIWRDGN